MSSIYGAYLEDYHYIKVIIPVDSSFQKLFLSGENSVIDLNIFKEEVFGKERHLHCSFIGRVSLVKDYYVFADDISYYLKLGKITRTYRFDYENYTDDFLGYQFSIKKTIFHIWSPVAKEVKLVINNKEYDLSYKQKGIWEAVIEDNLELANYYYLVRTEESFKKVLDPYAIAATPNQGENIVIDKSKLYVPQKKYFTKTLFKYTDAVISEISIRDLTYNTELAHKGTFLGASLSSSTDEGIGFLKKIGYTHLQLMPVFCFGGVNENLQDYNVESFSYNWGYNPLAYNCLSLWLTSNQHDPYSSIDEFTKMVETLHNDGFGVNMDVVYNHVYDIEKFPYTALVPGYCFRTDDKGFLTNSSGCGNDLATDKLMIRRYIIDSLLYWQTTFYIDGFRFDLMNLIDVDTLNKAANMLLSNNSLTMVYGEGWNMSVELSQEKRGSMENFWELPHFAFFNDLFRNEMKGNFDSTLKGFCLGRNVNHRLLFSLFTGCSIKEERFSTPGQSLNYVECHDGLTFYDTLRHFNISETEIVDRTILSLGCVVFSLGIPFFNLGEELMRSKQGFSNSYNAGDEVNAVDYSLNDDKNKIINSFTSMLKIRGEYDCFRYSNVEDIKKYYSFDTFANSFRMKIFNISSLETLDIIIKNNYEEEKIYFAPGSFLFFNGYELLNQEITEVVLNHPTIFIVKK